MRAQAQAGAHDLFHRAYAFGTTQDDFTFEVCPKGDYFELYSQGGAFARLDKAFCNEARRLVGLGVEFEAFLDRKRREETTKAWTPSAVGTMTFLVDVNVKSLMHHAGTVGNILLRSGIFLQFPLQRPGGETYLNPQILQIKGFHEKADETMAEGEDVTTPTVGLDGSAQCNPKPSRKSEDHVEQILDSLTHTNVLQEIRTDASRIKTDLMT